GAVTYSYDPYGRVLTRTDPDGLTNTVAYDADGRPKSKEVDITSTSSPVTCFERTYDAVSNVLKEAQRDAPACGTQSTGWNTYTYDNPNRMIQSVEGSTTTGFEYDGAGNRTSVQVNGGTKITTSYDSAGLPTGATDGTIYTVDDIGELTCITTTTCASGTQY